MAKRILYPQPSACHRRRPTVERQVSRLLERFGRCLTIDALNPTRLSSGVGQIGDEIVRHLNALLDAQIEVTLEIQGRVPKGIPGEVMRAVSENARTPKFEQFEFEQE